MLLKAIKLVSRYGNTVIRTIKFHQGLNFVLDDENFRSRNYVGNTTFLKLIDIALGARNKQDLYRNSETGEADLRLRKLIENKKICVILILSSLVNDRSDGKSDIELRVDLFKKGRKFINSVCYNEKEFNIILNRILFDNKDNIPTFRSLISSFVRVPVNKDRNVFLYNFFPNYDIKRYEMIFDYLFNTGDPKNLKILMEQKNELKSLNLAKKRYLSVNAIRNETKKKKQLTDDIVNTKEKIQRLQNEVSDLIEKKSFLSNREKISDIRKHINSIDEYIDYLKYNIESSKDSIKLVEKQKEDQEVDNESLTSDFFKEIEGLIPEINKTFEDLVNFNNALYDNKITYLNEIEKRYSDELKKKEKSRNQFIDDNKDVFSLIENNDVKKYDQLNQELISFNKDLVSKQETLDTLNEFNNKIKLIENEIKHINYKEHSRQKYYKENLELFNSYFSHLISNITDDNSILHYNERKNKFFLEIISKDEERNGIKRKADIICYDIAYQMFAKKINKKVPNFVVHDMLESIDNKELTKIIGLMNDRAVDMQLVVAISKEKLSTLDFKGSLQKKYSILQLSDDDRLFKD